MKLRPARILSRNAAGSGDPGRRQAAPMMAMGAPPRRPAPGTNVQGAACGEAAGIGEGAAAGTNAAVGEGAAAGGGAAIGEGAAAGTNAAIGGGAAAGGGAAIGGG